MHLEGPYNLEKIVVKMNIPLGKCLHCSKGAIFSLIIQIDILIVPPFIKIIEAATALNRRCRRHLLLYKVSVDSMQGHFSASMMNKGD